MIDTAHHISTVERTVGRRTLAAGEARTLTIARVYDTGQADLWAACTEPERIRRWFLPVSGDLREGGRFEIKGNASGSIGRCDAPHAFDATWEYGGQTSWIEVRLTPEGDARTRFALEHIAHVDDEIWAQYGPGAVGLGWDGALLGLSLHVADGGGMSPEEGAAWLASAEGRDFNARAGTAWGDADVAAGSDPETARAAAGRTIAAYTGQPAA